MNHPFGFGFHIAEMLKKKNSFLDLPESTSLSLYMLKLKFFGNARTHFENLKGEKNHCHNV